MTNLDNKRVSMIKVKGGFSDSKGITPYSTGIQVEEFDDRTRTIISNTLFEIIDDNIDDYNCYNCSDTSNAFCKDILNDVFGEMNRENYYRAGEWKSLYNMKIDIVIQNAPYNEVLDIVWYVCLWFIKHKRYYNEKISKRFNKVFENESVGYRFVSGNIVPITDPVEIEEIEQAAENKFEGCRNHIKKAVEYLSNRESKDYKNVIKESISAVESICKVITGNENATLGDALNFLKNKRNLNPILKVAFEKLYAYTNDKGGIRHADGLFTSDVTFEEAKFMLVSCSAFVNYLISEYGKTIGA